jgi:hypothetical protein
MKERTCGGIEIEVHADDLAAAAVVVGGVIEAGFELSEAAFEDGIIRIDRQLIVKVSEFGYHAPCI